MLIADLESLLPELNHAVAAAMWPEREAELLHSIASLKAEVAKQAATIAELRMENSRLDGKFRRLQDDARDRIKGRKPLIRQPAPAQVTFVTLAAPSMVSPRYDCLEID
jgi:predicted nuclease with TOPRIM domain